MKESNVAEISTLMISLWGGGNFPISFIRYNTFQTMKHCFHCLGLDSSTDEIELWYTLALEGMEKYNN